jgi:hypothetical protein
MGFGKRAASLAYLLPTIKARRLGTRGNALMLHFLGFSVSLDFLVLFYQEKRTKVI